MSNSYCSSIFNFFEEPLQAVIPFTDSSVVCKHSLLPEIFYIKVSMWYMLAVSFSL